MATVKSLHWHLVLADASRCFSKWDTATTEWWCVSGFGRVTVHARITVLSSCRYHSHVDDEHRSRPYIIYFRPCYAVSIMRIQETPLRNPRSHGRARCSDALNYCDWLRVKAEALPLRLLVSLRQYFKCLFPQLECNYEFKRIYF